MKSARGRDRTGLEGRPATFRSGRRRRGYTTGRAGHRRRQLFNCVFPRGRGAAPGARRGAAQLATLRPQPSSPGDQLRSGIFLLPTLQASSSARGPGRFPCAPRAQPLGASGARGRRPVRCWTASRPPSVPLAAPFRGPVRPRVQESGGRAGLPARVGGVWAPLEARGVPPPGSPPAGALSWEVGLRRGRARSASAPLPGSAARVRGAPGQGWLLGSDWSASAPSLFRQLSLGTAKLLTHRKPFRPLRAFCLRGRAGPSDADVSRALKDPARCWQVPSSQQGPAGERPATAEALGAPGPASRHRQEPATPRAQLSKEGELGGEGEGAPSALVVCFFLLISVFFSPD